MQIVNKVQKSGIQVYNLESLWDQAPVVEFDLKPFLIAGLVLREKDFRRHVAEHDWSVYADQHVGIYCSTDAIVPTWGYLLVASRLEHARSVVLGRKEDVIRDFFASAIENEDWGQYRDKIVVIKGCGTGIVPESAYVQAMQKLMAVSRKVMYGEPCSNVPLWRRKR